MPDHGDITACCSGGCIYLFERCLSGFGAALEESMFNVIIGLLPFRICGVIDRVGILLPFIQLHDIAEVFQPVEMELLHDIIKFVRIRVHGCRIIQSLQFAVNPVQSGKIYGNIIGRRVVTRIPRQVIALVRISQTPFQHFEKIMIRFHLRISLITGVMN